MTGYSWGMMLFLLVMGCAPEEDEVLVCEDAWCLACQLCPDEAAHHVSCEDPPVREDVDSWNYAMAVCGFEAENR